MAHYSEQLSCQENLHVKVFYESDEYTYAILFINIMFIESVVWYGRLL